MYEKMKETISVAGRKCDIFYRESEPITTLLLQPMGEHELSGIAREYEQIQAGTETGFMLAAFRVNGMANCRHGRHQQSFGNRNLPGLGRQPCRRFWKRFYQKCWQDTICQKKFRLFLEDIPWQGFLPSGQRIRLTGFRKLQQCPPLSGFRAGWNI